MQGTLQSLNFWLTRARDVQKIALKLQVERSRSLVAQVVAEMTSWALNATVQENRNGSCTNKHPPSKKDVEERIAEIIDSRLAGDVDEDGVDMVIISSCCCCYLYDCNCCMLCLSVVLIDNETGYYCIA